MRRDLLSRFFFRSLDRLRFLELCFLDLPRLSRSFLRSLDRLRFFEEASSLRRLSDRACISLICFVRAVSVAAIPLRSASGAGAEASPLASIVLVDFSGPGSASAPLSQRDLSPLDPARRAASRSRLPARGAMGSETRGFRLSSVTLGTRAERGGIDKSSKPRRAQEAERSGAEARPRKRE